ncbi:MAG TPA: GDSL-type esterase/lipase family protein [Nitrospirota bacterium]|nr:GDSL-type esterase/lipase family protein [Nitrospirota bacterium]
MKNIIPSRASRRLLLLVACICLLIPGIHLSQKAMSKKIVFIGDSLTEWFDWQTRFPHDEVTNLGISGEPIEGLLDRRESIRSRVQDPDYIFLMTGINNIGMGQYEINSSYREIVRNFTTWYKRSRLVVQSILPVEIPGINNNVIVQTNRELEQITREFHAEYLDVYSRFVDSEGNPRSEFLQDDGVHLSSAGYRVWSNEVERFLTR